jgi:hypothetical protein
MPDIKISQLPVASIVNDNDIVVLNQGGDTKTAAKSLIVAGLATTAQISGLNSAQVEALASAQIAAITPASIGAVATSDVIAISKGGTGATDAVSALTNLGGITSAQVPAFDTQQLNAYVLKSGSTMEGRLVMAATTDQAKANIGGALAIPAPGSSIAGDVWISNQSKLTFSPTTGTAVTVAGLSQANTFNQAQTIGVGGTVNSLTIQQNGTGRAATFTANSSAPAVAITQSGTGAALSVDSKGILFYDNTTQSGATRHYAVDLAATSNQAGTSNTGVTPNTFTYSTTSGVQVDSISISVGTLLLFTAQASPTQNGPWIATTANVSGVSGFVLTRPTWFSGAIGQAVTISVGQGNTRSGYIYTCGKATNGLITVGSSDIVVSVVNYNQNALTTAQITGFATTAQLSAYQTALTSTAPAAITQGGTGATTAVAALSNLGGITSASLAGLATTTQISTLQPALTSAAPLALSQGGTGATTAVAALSNLGALSATAAASGDLSGNYPSPTVAKIQGQAVSSAAPGTGQVLTWNGTTWVATAPAAGGSGGGGVLFYFNYGTNPDAPAPGGAKELGRVAEVALSSITTPTLTSGVWTDVAGFVSDTLDPNLEFLPAGIFDFNVWCNGTANTNAPTVLRVQVNKWDGTTSTNIATSGNAVVSNNGTPIQTAISLVISQTDITPADRLYIVIQVQASAAGHTVTVDFGDGAPSHVHTTIPSVGGTGVVKVINGVPQNPASFIINADIATDAAIALSKVQMSQVSVSAGAGLTGGGNLSASRTIALATTGIPTITGAGSSVAVPVISANIYGQITALTTEAIAVGGSGTVTSITAGTGLTGGTITGTGTIALETAGPGVLTNVGSSAAVPVISVDAYGRISALQTASLSQLGAGTVTSIAMTSQVSGLSFEPTSAITDNGTFNLTGVLDISNGGTGATTAVAALSNLGGITTDALSGYASTSQLAAYQPALTSAAPLAINKGGTGGINGDDAINNFGFPAQIRPVVSNVNLGTGTTANYVFTATTTIPSFVAHSILIVGDNILCSTASNSMNLGPWIVTTTGYQAVFAGTLAANSTVLTINSVTSGTVAIGQNIVIPNFTNTITIASFGTFNGTSGTVNLSGSITSAQTNVTMASGTGVPPVYTRPAWFRGTLLTSAYYFQIQKSSSVSAGQGNVYSIYPTSSSESLPSVTATAAGGTAWSNSIVSQRANNATSSSNTFSGRQTLWAGSAGGNIPLAFQAGTIANTPVAHAVEWDGAQMYVSNSATERLPVATSKVLINALAGTTYTIALTDAGYLITTSNTSAVTVSIPTDATNFPVGTQILVMQLGLGGQVTVAAVNSGTTAVNGKNGLKTSGQYAIISLIKVAANSWIVGGDATT